MTKKIVHKKKILNLYVSVVCHLFYTAPKLTQEKMLIQVFQVYFYFLMLSKKLTF